MYVCMYVCMTRTRFLALQTDTLNRYHAVFTVQIIFEGVVGNGYTGDIAVDDVKLGITKSVFTVQIIFEGVVGNGYTGDIAVDDVKLGITKSCSFTPDSARQGMSGLYLLYWA